MNKQVLRDLFLEKRKTLTQSELNRRSQLLCAHTLRFIQKQPFRHYHIFLPIQKQHEPDTWPVFDWLKSSEGFMVYLPKTNFKDRTLIHYQVDTGTFIETSKFGIPEPTNGKSIAPEVIEIVFVPLISYDLNGNRIGYGAGLYDRFLSQVSKACLKVGLAITPPLDNIDYAEPYDVKLDLCITHLGVDPIKKGA